MLPPSPKILYFDVSDACMTERLLNRAKTSGRADDNEETIKKRLATFHKHSEPVIDAYKSKCAAVSVLSSTHAGEAIEQEHKVCSLLGEDV